MRLLDTIKRAPLTVNVFGRFLLKPRSFIRETNGFRKPNATAKEIVFWCLGAAILISNVHKLTLGESLISASIVHLDDLEESAVPVEDAQTPSSNETRLPKVRRIEWFGDPFIFLTGIPTWALFFGRTDLLIFEDGVFDENGNPRKTPDEIINNALTFRLGFTSIYFDNVVLADLDMEIVILMFIFLIAFGTVVTLHFAAKQFGGTGSFFDALRLGLISCSCSLLYFVVLNTLISVFLISILRVEPSDLFEQKAGKYEITKYPEFPDSERKMTYQMVQNYVLLKRSATITLVIALIPLLRSYFISFRQFYTLTRIKLLGAYWLALPILTFVSFPLLFIPGLIIIIKYNMIWAAVF